MERYQEYKDSGEQWLGKIPSHWEMKRLGSYFNERKSKVSDKDYAPLSVTKNGILPQLENVAKSNDSDNRKQVCAGDFVINSRSDRKGSSGVSLLEGSVSLINIVLQPRKSIYSPFCNYLLKSNAFIEEYYRNGRGIVADLWTTRYDEMKSIKLAMPSLSEQTAMVSYLDRITAQIDKAIAQQQRMIDLLNERKQIIIQHAVTKGLDTNAEMVDSGVEWIGEMPKGWKSTPLRFVFEMRNGYTPSKNDPSFWNGGTIPWFRMEDIRKRGRFLKEATQYVTTKAVNGKGTFSAGSYIMAICTASIGEHAMLIADSLANQQFANFKICKSLSSLYSPMFLYYYFFVIGDFCRHNENSTCFQYVDMDALKNFPILQPSMKIQNEIVSFLDKNLERLEVTLKQTEKRISLLRERKQIIINEVVTGKVKVS